METYTSCLHSNLGSRSLCGRRLMVRPRVPNPLVQSTIDYAGNLLLGPIVYFRMFHKKSIVLNSGKVALDILEARSAIYSDRPVNWMAGELAGRKRAIFQTSLMDPRFKILRRLLQTGLNTRASKSYRPIQTQETQILLQNLVNAPEDFGSHLRR